MGDEEEEAAAVLHRQMFLVSSLLTRAALEKRRGEGRGRRRLLLLSETSANSISDVSLCRQVPRQSAERPPRDGSRGPRREEASSGVSSRLRPPPLFTHSLSSFRSLPFNESTNCFRLKAGVDSEGGDETLGNGMKGALVSAAASSPLSHCHRSHIAQDRA